MTTDVPAQPIVKDVMESELDHLFSEMAMNAPYPAADVEEIVSDFIAVVGPIPHLDYLDLMRRHAGCAGALGSGFYIVLWPLDEVVSGAEEAQVEEFAPGLLVFGGDGGNEAFAFDRQDPRWPIVCVPLVGMSRNAMKFVATTFTEFIRRLATDGLPI